MAAGDVTITNQLVEEMATAFFGSGTFKASLHNLTGGFNKDTMNHFSDVTGEIAASGYTAGGITLVNVAATRDNTNDRMQITWDAATITALGAATITHIIIRKDTGTAATSPIVCAIDALDSNGNDYQITPGANGVIWLNSF
ncbi:MAG: hypothetical protein CUN56_00220 [Phototrophicales bacterium]|nr:MAG: hypothetical protein CUN56_00220 [Phototrophicales bacterium]